MQLDARLGLTNRVSCAVDHGTHNFSTWLFQICGKKRNRSCRFHLVIFSLGMESCQTVFSGVLPGVESLCPRRKQA